MPSLSPDDDWPRLASYVLSARLDAGYRTREMLADAAGVTVRTLNTLEAGRLVGPETLARVERAVGWRPDSARQVLRGGEPAPVHAAAEPRQEPGPFADMTDEQFRALGDAFVEWAKSTRDKGGNPGRERRGA